MKRIRIVWKINQTEGKGLSFPPEQRKLLESWCDSYNEKWGAGTHWVEEFEE